MDRSFLLLIAGASALTFAAVFALSGAAPGAAPAPADEAVHYADCDAVRAAGKAPLQRGQPGFRASLDYDGDGVVCAPPPPVGQPSGDRGGSAAPPPTYPPPSETNGIDIRPHRLG